MTSTLAPATITYRKTKAGAWVAYGPASEIKTGPVLVTKRSGEMKQEHIASVGKPFTVDGVLMVYGYLEASTKYLGAPTNADPRRSSRTAWYDDPDHRCFACRCHEQGAPFDGCDRCGCDGDC